MDRKIPPPITDALHFDLELKPYKYFELDNGVPVYAIQAGTQKLLQIEWVFYAGNSFDKEKGVAVTTNFLLKNGTTTRTAFQINEEFDFYGAACSRRCFNETASIVMHTLTRHADKMLPVITDMITNSTMPEEELNIFKQNAIQQLKVNLQKSGHVADREINSMLYGEKHPYGSVIMPEDLEQISLDSIRSFYDTYYRNGKCAIFVAGYLPENIETLLNEHFGSLPLSKPDSITTNQPVMPSDVRQDKIIIDPKGVQAAIRIASPFPNRHHPDFKPVMVLNTLFGGFFGSRLMNNIREDKGYTYGIYSYIKNQISTTAWLVSTEVGVEVYEPAIREIYKEMERLQNEPVDDQELLLVKNYLMGSILGDLDGAFSIIGRWKNIILNGLDHQYFYESVEVIRSVTPAELKALAQKYLQPEKFYELVVI